MPNAPRLNRAQVRSLKRRIALRNRLTMKALEARYGLGRKAIWEYANGTTPALEDWTFKHGRSGSAGKYD